MKKNILCFFRASLGDFYLSFPLFYTLRNTYKDDKLTLVASSLVTPLLHNKGPWFDKIISPEEYTPKQEYDRILDLDINRTGMSATFKSNMDFFDILESTYDISFNRDKFPELFKLEYTNIEKREVDELLEKTRRVGARNVVIHTTHKDKFPYGKTPPQQWWEELISLYPQHNFYQVGTTKKLAERMVPDYDFSGKFSNVFDVRDRCNLKQTSYLLEQTDFFIAVDSIVAHLSLASGKRGLVLWGSSSVKIHGHSHNYNISPRRPCSPCIDLSSNTNCCLYRDPSLYSKVDTVARVLRENFLLNPPKKSGWLISENAENVTKNL
jgi:ADP-heptose:LPS heptosyltransferase